MEYTKLGNSGLKVSKLILGCLDFGSNISEEDSFRIMNRAVELGINCFDTSNSYGVTNDDSSCYGRSETIIGKWLAQDPQRRDKIIINTKCFYKLGQEELGPNDEDGLSAYKMRMQLEQSLKRLQTDHVEIYTMHKYNSDINAAEIWNTYEYFFDSGKVYYAGASNFSAYMLGKFQNEAEKRNLLGLVCTQNRYNLCKREIEIEIVEAISKEKISLFAWSPLYGGRLSSKVFSPPKEGRQIRTALSKELKIQLIEYASLCKKYGLSEDEVAYGWLLQNGNVDNVLVGANSVEELEKCVKSLDIILPKSLTIELDELFPKCTPAPDFYMEI